MLEAMLLGTAYAIDSFTSGERPGLTIATFGVPPPILCEAELQQVQDGPVFAFTVGVCGDFEKAMLAGAFYRKHFG
jgi:hypothetical protein